ncbi:CRTAC1 family protein [Pelagicoccus sp. SDUM812003]|nr:CRTAC1 family protein [Pelagicoccus sp. SDUM812003]
MNIARFAVAVFPAFALIETTASPVTFKEVTDQVGLNSEPSWKYSGPTVADLNNDGRYDLVLCNHDRTPIQIFWGQEDNTFKEAPSPLPKCDAHGIAPGDYDNDGDMDLVVAVGGGNGQNPKAPHLLRNDDGNFVDVTDAAGISGMGARGRSPRWVDLDSDGDLDLLQINAAQIVNETGPRNLLFENQGDGTFVYRSSPAFEQLDAERVLLTDFNGDHIPDLIVFSPIAFWQGDNAFGFEDVTKKWLPPAFFRGDLINAVAEADIDNDGDPDYYLARGKTHYRTGNDAISFDPQTGRLDLRDEGNKSHDGLEFTAGEQIELCDFYHWPRGRDVVLPVFLGSNKTLTKTPTETISIDSKDALGFPDSTSEDGWFLGYLGDGIWRLEWNLNDNLAWDIRASILGVSKIDPYFVPQDLGEDDVLLRNDGNRFTEISGRLPIESRENNWGVTHGDFNNDGLEDFFVYRFGELVYRVPDLLILNKGDCRFEAFTDHGANKLPEKSHGDMGSTLDFDLDGRVDILSGDDDNGRWRLYRNTTEDTGNYLTLHIQYSNTGIDPIGAEVTFSSQNGKHFQRVGSRGTAFYQSVHNFIHFGLGETTSVEEITIRWRDGSTQTLQNITANQIVAVGHLGR